MGRMRRLLALVVLAMSLALASGPAFAMPKADCPMAASGQMQDHADMDCCAVACAPECATVCPSAVVSLPQRGGSPILTPAPTDRPTAQRLPSASVLGADPPPRTTFS